MPEVGVPVKQILGLGAAVELDQDAVRVDDIAEVLPARPVARRARPLAGGALGHLGQGQELIAEPGEAGARHAHGIVRPGVDRQEPEPIPRWIERRQPLVQGQSVGARAGRPERALRDRLAPLGVEPAGRRNIDFGVQQVDAVGGERRQPGHGGALPRRPERRPPVQRAHRVDGVHVNVVEAGQRQRRRLRPGVRGGCRAGVRRASAARREQRRRQQPRRRRETRPTHRRRCPRGFRPAPGPPRSAGPPARHHPPAAAGGSGLSAGRRRCLHG